MGGINLTLWKSVSQIFSDDIQLQICYSWKRHDMKTLSELLAPCEENPPVAGVTGPLWGETTGNRWIPPHQGPERGLWWFLWCWSKQMVEQPIEMPVILERHEDYVTSL